MGLLFSSGNRWAGVAGGMLNLAFAMAEKFPASVGGSDHLDFLSSTPCFRLMECLREGQQSWLSQRVERLFLHGMAACLCSALAQAPVRIQYPVPQTHGPHAGLVGLGAGLSALALQGHFALSFPLAFSLALIGSLLFSKNNFRGTPETTVKNGTFFKNPIWLA